MTQPLPVRFWIPELTIISVLIFFDVRNRQSTRWCHDVDFALRRIELARHAPSHFELLFAGETDQREFGVVVVAGPAAQIGGNVVAATDHKVDTTGNYQLRHAFLSGVFHAFGATVVKAASHLSG